MIRFSSFSFPAFVLTACVVAMPAVCPAADPTPHWIDHNHNGVKDLYEDPAAPIDARVRDLLGRMTLEEKIGQMQHLMQTSMMDRGQFSPALARQVVGHDGVGSFLRVPTVLTPESQADVISQIQAIAAGTRLGIPVLFGQNACYGYADMHGASVFPGGISMASTWDPALIHATAAVTARECSAVGVYWTYAPVLEIAREPRWGRTGETLGEDPYLNSVMGYYEVKGYQGDPKTGAPGIIATAKHYAVNSAPAGGLNANTADLSDRTLREVFLPPFRAAVAAGAGSFMAAHNEINGMPCHCNPYLLTDILRGEFGFTGMVVSDYSDIERIYSVFNLSDTIAGAGRLAAEAGVDADMVGAWEGDPAFGAGFTQLVRDGAIPMTTIDRAAGKVLQAKFRLGLFDRRLAIAPAAAARAVAQSQAENRKVAGTAARESLVLLQNKHGLLPLAADRVRTVAVIGPNADSRAALFPMKYNNPVTPMLTVRQAIEAKAGGRFRVAYAEGCPMLGASADDFAAAVAAAKNADVAIVVVGETSVTTGTEQEEVDARATVGEGVDRADLGLPGVQEQLVEAVHATGTPTIVVLLNGRPLAIEWIAEHVPAILEAWGPGEEGGSAIADVLFGDANPGGKLPVTVPRSVAQLPVFYNHDRAMHDGSRSGYVDMPSTPLFPFGHGLSYTTFGYSGLEMAKEFAPGQAITCRFTVENTGGRDGDEVVQVYIRDLVASVVRPVMELKAFRRVPLARGGKTQLEVTIPAELLAFYGADGKYGVEPGRFELMIGSSSQDIRLKREFTVTGDKLPVDFSKTFFSTVAPTPITEHSRG